MRPIRSLPFMLLLFAPLAVQAETLRIGMPEWCPYTCTDPAKPGIMVEITRDILKAQGIDAEFTVYENWNRLVHDSKKGRKIDALLAVGPTEVPELVYPESPMVEVLISFFVRRGYAWNFTGPESFEGQVVLGFENIDYGPVIQPYIDVHKNDRSRVELATGETEEVFLHKVAKNRGDIYLEDKNVGLYMIKNEGLGDKIVLGQRADTPKPLPLSIGFSPKLAKAQTYAKIISDGTDTLKAGDGYQALLNRYIR